MNTSRRITFRIIALILLVNFSSLSSKLSAQSQDYCWNGTCYTSLAQAESAMRSHYGPAGRYLEAFRTLPLEYSPNAFRNYYAVDIKALEFHAPYAYWSFMSSGACTNSFPTPDHYNKCNSLSEAAAKADEYWLSSPNVCFSQTTPDGGSYYDFPAGGAAWYDSRDWFAALFGRNTTEVTIRQFQNPTTHLIRFNNEDCAITHTNLAYDITVLEYGYCPDGLWDDYDNKSPVNPGVRRTYPYECGHSAIPEIETRRALPTPSCPRGEGNPCDPLTGNKRISETDFEHPSLPVSRHYNSLSMGQSLADVGRGWTHNYSSRIKTDSGYLMLHLPDGSISTFEQVTDSSAYVSHQLTHALLYLTSSTEAELRYDNGDVWKYESLNSGAIFELVSRDIAQDVSRSVTIIRNYIGLVTDVIDRAGRSLKFNYQGDYLVSIDLPDANQIRYFYEDPGLSDKQRLVQVEYQDGTSVQYRHDDGNHPYHVTSIIDELGAEYATYAFDETGRVVLSEHAGGAGRVELSYAGLDTTVTTPAGDTRVYDGTTYGGYTQNRFPSYHSITDGDGTRAVTWRSASPRRKLSQTDPEGNLTQYQYDNLSRVTSKRTGVGTVQEVEIIDTWDATHNRITQHAENGAATAYTYNSRAQVLSRTLTDTASGDSRIWSYSYFEPPSLGSLIGKVQTIDGPRTDLGDSTSYEYYSSDHAAGDYLIGDLKAVVNALGHRSEYLKYDWNGRPLEIKDANGVLTVLSYHPRGWIGSRTTDGQTTAFDYDDAGNLTRVTQPDGSYIDYEYDTAHRLNAIADNFNNRVEYTLNAAGNRIAEVTYDDAAVLKRQLGRVYDTLNRLHTLIDGNNDQTHYGYDNNGNRSSTLDANLNTAGFEYDPLNRLVKTIDSILGETLMDYDDRDNLVRVTDPLGNVTQYAYDGLDNQIQLDSPDTGVSSYEYDAAGNRTATTDARNVRVEYIYDALNRLTDISYPDSTLDVSFTYDAGINGKGRLSSMTDAAGTVSYSYDARGNLLSESRGIGADLYVTSYAWNPSDRLVRISYPSGMEVDYTLDATGRITAVEKTVDALSEVLASNIQYEPFGPVRSFTYGNGLGYSATYDQDYELDQLQSGPGLDWQLAYDPAGNILSIDDQINNALDQTFSYDDLYRLETSQGGYPGEFFEYDANSNRTRYLTSSEDHAYTYEPQSNRLATKTGWAFTRDAAGNRTGKLDVTGHGQVYHYADHNRLTQTSARDSSGDTVVGEYSYDGRGQRVSKTVDGITIHYVFGPSGELLGEYQSGSVPVSKEYIYLNGQPVAVQVRRQEIIQPPGVVYIVDNDSADTTSTGSWSLKSHAQAYNGNHRQARKKSGNTYRWEFTHGNPGSVFRVSAWWVSHNSFSSQVDYSIAHDAGGAELDVATVNQKSGGGQWQDLGTYAFWGGAPEWVEITAANGKTSADAIRFEEIPDPVIVNSEAIFFIHSDHLGTPRHVSDDTQSIVWRWDSTPFGDSAPDQDPDGNFQEFVLDLRYPGQYFDAESSLHYNYFRTYDPGTGRYIESDPIGLGGGLNPYVYTANAPVGFIDPYGLEVTGEWAVGGKPMVYDFRAGIPRWAGYSFGDVRYLPPGFRVGHFNVDVSARVSAQVKCTRSGETAFACTDDKPKIWYLSDARTISTNVKIPYRYSLGPWQLKLAVIADRAVDKARSELTRIAFLLYKDPTLICMWGF